MCCVACGASGVALHHVRTRGSGGTNLDHNLMPLCQEHHNEIHLIGTSAMAYKFDGVDEWLFKHGWEYEPYAEKWVHDLE